MSYWGKVLGGMAGLAMGGPPGAVMGAALGHAVDSGALGDLSRLGQAGRQRLHPARIVGMLAPKEQLFALSVVALSAKLAKCDGPVNRSEIDGFKRYFRVPAGNAREVGRWFDQARDTAGGFEPYAQQLGARFSDNPGVLEDVLAGLFGIARADGAVNATELDFLAKCARGFGLDGPAWERARGGAAGRWASDEPDPYEVLGVHRSVSDAAVRAAWKQLMRENHPDGLAARGVPPEFVAKATEKVARINAAWDQVKRERGI